MECFKSKHTSHFIYEPKSYDGMSTKPSAINHQNLAESQLYTILNKKNKRFYLNAIWYLDLCVQLWKTIVLPKFVVSFLRISESKILSSIEHKAD